MPIALVNFFCGFFFENHGCLIMHNLELIFSSIIYFPDYYTLYYYTFAAPEILPPIDVGVPVSGVQASDAPVSDVQASDAPVSDVQAPAKITLSKELIYFGSYLFCHGNSFTGSFACVYGCFYVYSWFLNVSNKRCLIMYDDLFL